MKTEVGARSQEWLREMQVLLRQQIDQLDAEIEEAEGNLAELKDTRRIQHRMLAAIVPSEPEQKQKKTRATRPLDSRFSTETVDLVYDWLRAAMWEKEFTLRRAQSASGCPVTAATLGEVIRLLHRQGRLTLVRVEKTPGSPKVYRVVS